LIWVRSDGFRERARNLPNIKRLHRLLRLARLHSFACKSFPPCQTTSLQSFRNKAKAQTPLGHAACIAISEGQPPVRPTSAQPRAVGEKFARRKGATTMRLSGMILLCGVLAVGVAAQARRRRIQHSRPSRRKTDRCRFIASPWYRAPRWRSTITIDRAPPISHFAARR